MTQPTGTFSTYDAIGNREDLSDVIWNVAPTNTPFMTMADKSSATATLHEWQTDTLRAAAANAAIEGDDAASANRVPTVRLNNVTQISDENVVVTGTQRAVNSAGRDELPYQVEKASKQLKRDMEFIITGNQASASGSDTVARQLRSLEAWYTTNTDRGAGGASGSTTQAATDGTQRAFTEALVKTVLADTFTAGGEPDVIMVGPKNKQNFSGFSTFDNTREVSAGDETIFAGVTMYSSDFGTLKIVPNRFQRDRTAHILQMDLWAVSELRPFQLIDLATTGDSTKKLLLNEYTLEARNEAGSGVVADLTT